MSEARTALVIGAGLIGLSVADSLARRGVAVTVLDARSGPARGTSFSNSGMIHPSQCRDWAARPGARRSQAQIDADSAVRELAVESAAQLRKRMSELGLNDMLARPRGCYQLYTDVEAARAAQARFARDGVAANMVIDPSRTFSRPALYFPDDRSANAHEYGVALAEDLAAREVIFIYDAQGVRLRWDSKPGQVAVSYGSHRFRADDVIIAAGSQSGEVVADLGLRVRVTPVRGWAVDFDLPAQDNGGGADALGLPPVPVMDAQSRSALTVFDDRFRLSGTWGQDSARPLLERWADIIPGALAKAGKARSVWSGLRPVSDAGRPYIGAAPIPDDQAGPSQRAGEPSRLWVNTGHGHLGWTLCTGSGELMARMILDGVQDPRFAYGG